jgi:hypothetical protein
MIGARTLSVLVLVAGGVAAAVGLGALAPERLFARGWGDLCFLGSFGVVVGTLVFRLWRLGERSAHYFRYTTDAIFWEGAEAHFLGGKRRRIVIGETPGVARELPPRLRHALCVAAALLYALAVFDTRALGLLEAFATGIGRGGTYCPEPSAAAAAAPVEDPNAPGCALIRRAYALGYADSLGDCAPDKKRAATSEAAVPICTLRQRDEPLLHYSWRRLISFWQGLEGRAHAGTVRELGRDFGKRLDHLKSLAASQRQVLDSAPHASHHIFTNLPDPGGAFRGETCGDRYLKLGHRPDAGTGPLRASRVFEHVVGQLLFEARYEPAAASCREVHVHFGAPPDTCEALAANPEAVLTRFGALAPVRAALARYRVAEELVALGGRAPAASPEVFLSFQCYVEDGARATTLHRFSLDGYALDATSSHVAPLADDATLFTDRYDALARLLVRGFHYGALLSEAGLAQPAAGGLEASFAGKDYLLSRLYGLENVDLYLDPSWIGTRSDLLEVYPYRKHLKNYVQIFRRQYARERGRL